MLTSSCFRAAVKSSSLCNIKRTELLSMSKRSDGRRFRSNCVRSTILRECVPTIMHDALQVISQSQCVCLAGSNFEKLTFKTVPDVVVDDIDILIPIWPGVFMVEANSVTKLVDHNTIDDATGS